MKKRLGAELAHFKTLSTVAQQLLISSTIYELAYPILFTFLSAFLFRSTGGFLASALFNIGLMIGIPAGFYLNGLLLAYCNSKWLFLVGLLGQGLVASTVFFLPSVTPIIIFIIGFLQGLPMGLYFGNRNFITLEVTQDGDRSYYTGLEQIVGNIAGVISPVITGWAIVFGAQWSRLSLQQTYQLLAAIATLGLIVGGRTFFSAEVNNPTFTKLWLGKLQSAWSKGRLREVLYGMSNGIKIVTFPLLVLFAVGKEGALGTMQSLAAIVASGVLYVLARKIKVENRKMLMWVCVLINILCVLPLFLTFSLPSIILFLLAAPTVQQLFWVAFHPYQLQIIDGEDNGSPANNYAYIADRELHLNIGRVLAIILFLVLFQMTSNEYALRLAPLIIALLQLGFLVLL